MRNKGDLNEIYMNSVQLLCNRSQSYQTLISSFLQFLLLNLATSKYRQYFLILQTLKLINKKRKKYSFYEEKSLVGLTPGI
jgi:hypothetical protein